MPSRASLAADWLSYSPEKTTQKPAFSDEKSSERSTPTSAIPSPANFSAASCASDSDESDASTTVQPDLPDGHSAMSDAPPLLLRGVEVASGVDVAEGVVVGSGVSAPLASGRPVSGAIAAPGSGVAVGTGVGATAVVELAGGFCATTPVSSASWTIAIATAIAATTRTTPAMTIGARQPGAATTRVPTAAPHARHHSCSSLIAEPQRGHWRPVGCSGGGGV